MAGTNPEVLREMYRDPASLATLLGLVVPNIYYQGNRVVDLRSALTGFGGLYGGAAQAQAYEQALRAAGQKMPTIPSQNILQPVSPGEAPAGPIQAMPMGEPGTVPGGSIFPARPLNQTERSRQLMEMQVPSLQQLVTSMPSEQFRAVFAQGIPGGVGRAPMLAGRETIGEMRTQAVSDIDQAKGNVYAEAVRQYMADPLGNTDAKDAMTLLLQGADKALGLQFMQVEAAKSATVRLLQDTFGIKEGEARKYVASGQETRLINLHFEKQQAREQGTVILDQVEKMGVLPPEQIQYWRGLVVGGLPLPTDFATKEATRSELAQMATRNPDMYRMIASKTPMPEAMLAEAVKRYPNLSSYFAEENQKAQDHQLNVQGLRNQARSLDMAQQTKDYEALKATGDRLYQIDALLVEPAMRAPEAKEQRDALLVNQARMRTLYAAQHERILKAYDPGSLRAMTLGEVMSNIAKWRIFSKEGKLKQEDHLGNIATQAAELRKQLDADPQGPIAPALRQGIDELNKEWQYIQGKVVPPEIAPEAQGYPVAPGTTAPSVMAPGIPGLGYEAGKRMIESIMPKTPKTPSAPQPPAPTPGPPAPGQPVPTPVPRTIEPKKPESRMRGVKPTAPPPQIPEPPPLASRAEGALTTPTPPPPPPARMQAPPAKQVGRVSLPPRARQAQYASGAFAEDMTVADSQGNLARLPAGQPLPEGSKAIEPYSTWQAREVAKQYLPVPLEMETGTMVVPPKGARTSILPKGKRPEDMIPPPTKKDEEAFRKAWPKKQGATQYTPPRRARQYKIGEKPAPQEIDARVQSIFQKHWASMWPYTGGNYGNMFPSNLDEIRGIAERQLLEGVSP